MTPDAFIDAIRIVVRDSAADGCIGSYEKPPGRSPSPKLIEMSKWFCSLADSDKAMVQRIAQDVADAAVFQFLCVLDGVVAVEDRPDKGDFRLTYVNPPVELVINDPSDEFLHDRWNTN
jgi:hypothetical protein